MAVLFRSMARNKWAVLAVASLVALALVRVFWPSANQDSLPAPEAEPSVLAPVPRPSATADRSAVAGLRFENVTEAVGLDDFRPRGGRQSVALPTMTAGMAMSRSDGSLRVLFTSPSGPVKVYQFNGKGFRDVTVSLGLQDAGTATAAAFADLDGDGDDDLILARRTDRVVSVMHQEGGKFHDVTRTVGVRASSTAPSKADLPETRGVALADVNNDGHLDFLVGDLNASMFFAAKYSPDGGGDRAACRMHARLQTVGGPGIDRISQTRLYLGSAQGKFTDATRSWGLSSDTKLVSTPQFIDLNGDGWQDLLMTGILCSNRVLLNDRGRRFGEVAESGAGVVPQGNGSVARDFDGDEIPDWLITGISYPTESGECPAGNPLSSCAGNALLKGHGDGTFSLVEGAAGLTDAGWAFGVVAEDFTNSRRLDVVVTNGFVGAAQGASPQDGAEQGFTYFARFESDPMALFVRDANGQYRDAATSAGINDAGAGRALAAVDYDEDGRLDLLVNNADTGVRLFRNVTRDSQRHWVDIALRDSTSRTNPQGYGSRVRVTTASGARFNDWIVSNSSFETQPLPEAHVGLGREGIPVTVEVWWPGTTRPRVYKGVSVDRRIVLTR